MNKKIFFCIIFLFASNKTMAMESHILGGSPRNYKILIEPPWSEINEHANQHLHSLNNHERLKELLIYSYSIPHNPDFQILLEHDCVHDETDELKMSNISPCRSYKDTSKNLKQLLKLNIIINNYASFDGDYLKQQRLKALFAYNLHCMEQN